MLKENERIKILRNLTDKIEEKLCQIELIITGRRDIQYGVQLFIEDSNGESIVLNIYKGKKEPHFVANKKDSYLYVKVLECIEEFRQNINIPYCKYIGTDESGKGDYFGPLVIAGFLTDNETNKKLYNLGVKDSKKIDDSVIFDLSEQINKEHGDRIVVLSIEPEKYNELYSHFVLERKSMNHLLAWGHARVIERFLEDEKETEGVIADQFGDIIYLKQSLLEKGKSVGLTQFQKAEYDMAVAAASILARAAFLNWLKINCELTGILIEKGASSQAEIAAIEIGKKYGLKQLRKYVKIHFKTTKKIINACNKMIY